MGTCGDNDSSVTLLLTLGKHHCVLKNIELILYTAVFSFQCVSLLKVQILGQPARKHYLITLCHWEKKKNSELNEDWISYQSAESKDLGGSLDKKKKTRRPKKDSEWCDLVNECLGRLGPQKWRWCWTQRKQKWSRHRTIMLSCDQPLMPPCFDAMNWSMFYPQKV